MQTPAFSEDGRDWEDIEREMKSFRGRDTNWRNGRLPLYVFFAGQDVLDVATKAYVMFMSENALGQAAFPSLERMEREVIAMTMEMLNAPEGATGGMTSGGSESIFLAMKAARDWARVNGRSKSPEVVLPITAHPAFNKAAHYLGLRARRVPIGRDYRADPQAMETAVGPDTIMIVGSAVAYPQGVVDPIREIGRVAVKHDLWMHVDACVGGFAAPFVRELGYPIRDFDFSVPGVTSISADLHKYGFTAKGASTVLYRSAEHRQYQWFEFSEWPKGKYRTPNVTGTRPGGAVSAAWAVMNHLGKSGYRRVHRQVMEMRDRYIAGIQSIDGLKVIGQPDLGIVPYRSDEFDIFAVAEQLSQRGWYQSLLAEPSGIHLMLSLAHDPVMDEYLDDLGQAVKAVQRGEARTSGRLVPVTY